MGEARIVKRKYPVMTLVTTVLVLLLLLWGLHVWRNLRKDYIVVAQEHRVIQRIPVTSWGREEVFFPIYVEGQYRVLCLEIAYGKACLKDRTKGSEAWIQDKEDRIHLEEYQMEIYFD